MPNIVTKWFSKHFSNPEVVTLVFTLLIIVGVFYLFGTILTPVFAAVVIAYLLDGLVQKLQRIKCPHILAVLLVFILAIGMFCVAIIWLLPLFLQQLINLAKELPAFIGQGNAMIARLQTHFPDAKMDVFYQHIRCEKSKILSAGLDDRCIISDTRDDISVFSPDFFLDVPDKSKLTYFVQVHYTIPKYLVTHVVAKLALPPLLRGQA